MELQCTPMLFRDNDEVVASLLVVLQAREQLVGKVRRADKEDAREIEALEKAVHRSNRVLHRRLSLTPRSVYLADIFKRNRLNRLEIEIFLVLLLDPMGLIESRISDVNDVLRVLSLSASESMRALRALSEAGKLYRKGLLFHDDLDEDLRDRQIAVDPGIVQSILLNKDPGAALAALKREDDLRDLLARISRSAQRKSDELNDVIRGCSRQAEFQKWRRKLDWLLGQLGDVLRARPAWNLSRARAVMGLGDCDWLIVLALLGKAMGHVNAEDDLFTGAGLARAVCGRAEHFGNRLDRLMSRAPLLQREYVQPCGGMGNLISESAESVQQTEFELTAKALHLLGIEQTTRNLGKRDTALRTPRIALADLALPAKTRASIDLALDHVRHAGRLMNTWGLRASFPYGTGVTVLFYGPPGTGKTATAEAIAHELDKPLLVADYAKLQNCFVGQTEKNIVSTFRKARQHDAVLFWDEADAMFFDRDAASRTWEVRDVNVLLQEIERFEGVCILATNRQVTLDKALERRITAKVPFPRPDSALRETIWRKLLPKRLPLAPGVDIARLSREDLAGGEIKNVILNAARFACGRGEDASVTADDFERALIMETTERWTQAGGRRIGFDANRSQRPVPTTAGECSPLPIKGERHGR
jgi:hypothetical protein